MTSALPRHTVMELIRCATLAPSGHNTQPWTFSFDEGSIRIFPDFSRCLPVVDPDNHALFISLGCALENLVIAAEHHGYHADVVYASDPEPDGCLTVYLNETLRVPILPSSTPFSIASRPASPMTATPYLPQDHLDKLTAAGSREGVFLSYLNEKKDLDGMIDLVKEGTYAQFRDPAFVEELLSWVRFTTKEVRTSHDGLTTETIGLPSCPRWLGTFIMKRLVSASSEATKCGRLIQSSSGLMIFIAKRNDTISWVNLGRSFERVALTATAQGIKHAHMNMPCEVVHVRRKVQNQLGLRSGHPLLLVRLGYAKPMPRSPRRPVGDVLIEG